VNGFYLFKKYVLTLIVVMFPYEFILHLFATSRLLILEKWTSGI